MVVGLSSILPSIGSFSSAGAVGALLGYGFKKLVKIFLIVMAAITALVGIPLGYLTYEGVITINWDRTDCTRFSNQQPPLAPHGSRLLHRLFQSRFQP